MWAGRPGRRGRAERAAGGTHVGGRTAVALANPLSALELRDAHASDKAISRVHMWAASELSLRAAVRVLHSPLTRIELVTLGFP